MRVRPAIPGFVAGVLAGIVAGIFVHMVWDRYYPPPRYYPGDPVVLVGLVTGSTRPPYEVSVDVARVGEELLLPGGTRGVVVGPFEKPGSLLPPRFWVRIDGLEDRVLVSQNCLVPDLSADRRH